MLSKLYREITGTKILDAISRIRVQEAKNLLLASNDNLTSIANQVGFGSTKTFTRSFKQFEGCTPGQWRDNQRMLISHPII
jgi:AraC-like DNA-binding protein